MRWMSLLCVDFETCASGRTGSTSWYFAGSSEWQFLDVGSRISRVALKSGKMYSYPVCVFRNKSRTESERRDFLTKTFIAWNIRLYNAVEQKKTISFSCYFGTVMQKMFRAIASAITRTLKRSYFKEITHEHLEITLYAWQTLEKFLWNFDQAVLDTRQVLKFWSAKTQGLQREKIDEVIIHRLCLVENRGT